MTPYAGTPFNHGAKLLSGSVTCPLASSVIKIPHSWRWYFEGGKPIPKVVGPFRFPPQPHPVDSENSLFQSFQWMIAPPWTTFIFHIKSIPISLIIPAGNPLLKMVNSLVMAIRLILGMQFLPDIHSFWAAVSSRRPWLPAHSICCWVSRSLDRKSTCPQHADTLSVGSSSIQPWLHPCERIPSGVYQFRCSLMVLTNSLRLLIAVTGQPFSGCRWAPCGWS